MKKYISSSIIAIFFLASCTKEIDIDLNTANPEIVIEGGISDQPGPYMVKLSKTINFSDSNNSFPPISGALVVISDNMGTVDTLTESTSGMYHTNSIVGTQGNTYTLKVVAEGKQYDAVTTMPYRVNLDSLRFDLFTDPGDADTTYAVVPLFLDPAPFGDNYRFFFTSNGIADKTYQVANDNIGNGDVNKQPFFSDDVEFYKGDTITVTMLCIDVRTYNYYFTLSQISESGPGGGAAPTNPPNNITGNRALGIFSAYTTQTRTAIVK